MDIAHAEIKFLETLLGGVMIGENMPEEIIGWLNVYPPSSYILSETINVGIGLYKSREIADRQSSESRIACLQVTFQKGEGL